MRGMLVRLTDAWQDILARRAANTQTGPYPVPVRQLLGEMAAAGVLMQGNIKFNGALILQIFGDGPVKVGVVEVQPDFSLRATCTQVGEVAPEASLSQMVNLHNQGRCAITLDPKDRLPGQQPYQGVVPLFGDQGEKLESISEVLQHYMLQSEQLDTVLVLAADDQVAAGLLIQRLPVEGEGNLAGQMDSVAREAELGQSEDFSRIAILAKSLKREELLTLDAETILHRLFWEEPLARFEPLVGDRAAALPEGRPGAVRCAARARGRKGGRKPALDAKQVREIKALLRDPDIQVADVAKRYGVSRATIYKHVGAVRPERGASPMI